MTGGQSSKRVARGHLHHGLSWRKLQLLTDLQLFGSGDLVEAHQILHTHTFSGGDGLEGVSLDDPHSCGQAARPD